MRPPRPPRGGCAAGACVLADGSPHSPMTGSGGGPRPLSAGPPRAGWPGAARRWRGWPGLRTLEDKIDSAARRGRRGGRAGRGCWGGGQAAGVVVCRAAAAAADRDRADPGGAGGGGGGVAAVSQQSGTGPQPHCPQGHRPVLNSNSLRWLSAAGIADKLLSASCRPRACRWKRSCGWPGTRACVPRRLPTGNKSAPY
jgi:hypothetical protein